jgi:hypothetical protein
VPELLFLLENIDLLLVLYLHFHILLISELSLDPVIKIFLIMTVVHFKNLTSGNNLLQTSWLLKLHFLFDFCFSATFRKLTNSGSTSFENV